MSARVQARLYIDPGNADGGRLGPGLTVGVDPGQAHYLKHVLRLKPGDSVALFNGRDGEWLARVDGLGKGWGSLALDRQTRPQADEPDLWLLFAPIKRTRIDFLVQKAAELGVGALWPVLTAHTDVSRVNTGRLRATAVEAAEQCERLTLPRLFEPVPLDRALADWPEDRRLMVCAEVGEARPIADFLAAVHGSAAAGPWAVLTGPEGGFSTAELDGLRKLPFVTPVSLGSRVLRAETAALAALSCWQAMLGDWRGRPSRA